MRNSSPLQRVFAWLRRRSTAVKILLAAALVVNALLALTLLVKDHDQFFVVSEVVHFVGILVLTYKLAKKKTCSGLSLKTQELTAMFLATRLCCSVIMEGDVHTVLDFLTLVSTLWVVYMIRFKLKSTYVAELDSVPLYYVALPSAILAALVHPYTHHLLVSRFLWAFSVYLESVSVLPQLIMMQKTKMIEPFTAHYVFALGVARFLGCAHWILQVYHSSGRYFYLIGAGYIWLPTVLLAEVVQTFILADFCYYYVKGMMNGNIVVSLPTTMYV